MPERTNIATCKTCRAPMRWVKTEKGKNMPVDEKPTENGPFVLVPDTDPPEVEWLSPRARSNHPGPFFTSHFETCPNRKQFRRP